MNAAVMRIALLRGGRSSSSNYRLDSSSLTSADSDVSESGSQGRCRSVCHAGSYAIVEPGVFQSTSQTRITAW